MFVALPAAIAFGISIYAPLGYEFAAMASLSGVLGTIAIGLITPLFGGTPRLISAPCAPAAAVLSVLVAELAKINTIETSSIPLLIGITIFLAGLFQILLGALGGGKLMKFIPYPVVAGYLSGLGILICSGQLSRFLGFSQFLNWQSWDLISIPSVVVGLTTIISMSLGIRYSKKVPPALIGLNSGILVYFLLSIWYPELLNLNGNKMLVGKILPTDTSISENLLSKWLSFDQLANFPFQSLIIPAFTLGFLLSIDTLKTCIVIDAMTLSRHDSNKELRGQGLGNICSALFGGVAGAGTLGPTLVNLSSGAQTRLSGFYSGLFSLMVLLFFTFVLQWLPISALAGVLMVLGFRMVDFKSVGLLKNPSTVLDFLVILIVVISALSTSLIIAAGVGIVMAILLFLREQVKSSVVRRIFTGDKKFSKKKRLNSENLLLEQFGNSTALFELQGQLFFGTADQLFNVLEKYITSCKNIVLDFGRVQSIDFTAVNMLKQIHARIKQRGGYLILASIPKALSTGHSVFDYLNSLNLSRNTPYLMFFEDKDEALEWTEDRIIKEYQNQIRDSDHPLEVTEFEFFQQFPTKVQRKLGEIMKNRFFPKGENIFRQGEVHDKIYFIRRGTVKIELPLKGSRTHHLATFGKGDFFGDMAFLDHEPRSADANAAEDTELFELSKKKFNKLRKKDPEVGTIFFETLAYTISQRLRLNLVELSAMQET